MDLLKVQDLTQAGLARKVKLTKQFVNYLAHGQRRASAFTAWRIANALGVDRGELFEPASAGERRPA